MKENVILQITEKNILNKNGIKVFEFQIIFLLCIQIQRNELTLFRFERA